VYGSTPPFQAMEFARALRNSNGSRTQFKVVIFGDSTSTQRYWGLFCGFVRGGAIVESCRRSRGGSHYPHCACPMYEKGHANGRSEGSALLRIGPIRYELRHEMNVWSTLLNHTDADVLLVEPEGHHAMNEAALKQTLENMGRFMGGHLHGRVVLWETTVSHFPTSDGSGLFKVGSNVREAARPGYFACGPVEAPQLAAWRQRLECNWMHHRYPGAKVLSLFDAEVPMHLSYTRASCNKLRCKGDCVHHLYAPLYYDLVFHRLAKLVDGGRQECNYNMTTAHGLAFLPSSIPAVGSNASA